jgi:hypothetical protein
MGIGYLILLLLQHVLEKGKILRYWDIKLPGYWDAEY